MRSNGILEGRSAPDSCKGEYEEGGCLFIFVSEPSSSRLKGEVLPREGDELFLPDRLVVEEGRKGRRACRLMFVIINQVVAFQPSILVTWNCETFISKKKRPPA